ncbi:MAG: hypothetical protein HYX76_00370 [Acidobacteria bacterium]|nr:hypothetical protein [Acidobacteriota bacterium]
MPKTPWDRTARHARLPLHAKGYIEQNMEFKFLTSKEATDWLSSRMAEARKLTNTFIQQQKAELATLQRQQAELGEKLGDRHPDIIKIRSSVQTAQAKLQGEIAKVVQSVRNEFLAAQAQERSLTSALDEQKRDALAMNRKAIEYGVLRREAESARQIYDSLLQRAKETGVSTELRTSNIRIVDRAELPRRPVTPQEGLNLLLGLFGGGLLAVGLAFFFEYLDNRIKRPDEIKTHLGLPFLPDEPHGRTLESQRGGSRPAPARPAFQRGLRRLLGFPRNPRIRTQPRGALCGPTGAGNGTTQATLAAPQSLHPETRQEVRTVSADVTRRGPTSLELANAKEPHPPPLQRSIAARGSRL